MKDYVKQCFRRAENVNVFFKITKSNKKGLAVYEKVARPFLYMLCMEIIRFTSLLFVLDFLSFCLNFYVGFFSRSFLCFSSCSGG